MFFRFTCCFNSLPTDVDNPAYNRDVKMRPSYSTGAPGDAHSFDFPDTPSGTVPAGSDTPGYMSARGRGDTGMQQCRRAFRCPLSASIDPTGNYGLSGNQTPAYAMETQEFGRPSGGSTANYTSSSSAYNGAGGSAQYGGVSAAGGNNAQYGGVNAQGGLDNSPMNYQQGVDLNRQEQCERFWFRVKTIILNSNRSFLQTIKRQSREVLDENKKSKQPKKKQLARFI